MKFIIVLVLVALAAQGFAAPSWPGIAPSTKVDDWNCDLPSWDTQSKDLFDCESFDVDPVPESTFCEPTKAAIPGESC